MRLQGLLRQPAPVCASLLLCCGTHGFRSPANNGPLHTQSSYRFTTASENPVQVAGQQQQTCLAMLHASNAQPSDGPAMKWQTCRGPFGRHAQASCMHCMKPPCTDCAQAGEHIVLFRLQGVATRSPGCCPACPGAASVGVGAAASRPPGACPGM